jgi:glycosyltransferase involved in cell wall biosynthesis
VVVDRYVLDDEASLYFSAADVVVLPYLRSSQSGVAHAAMAMGKPIIATPVGGLAESLGDYPGTTFVPPGDEHALRRALLAPRPDGCPPRREWDTVSERYMDVLEAAYEKPWMDAWRRA